MKITYNISSTRIIMNPLGYMSHFIKDYLRVYIGDIEDQKIKKDTTIYT